MAHPAKLPRAAQLEIQWDNIRMTGIEQRRNEALNRGFRGFYDLGA
jgi:hypothetical protein